MESNETCWKNHTKCESQDTLNLLFQLYLFCKCDDVDEDLPTDLNVILTCVKDDSDICGKENGNGNNENGNGNNENENGNNENENGNENNENENGNVNDENGNENGVSQNISKSGID